MLQSIAYAVFQIKNLILNFLSTHAMHLAERWQPMFNLSGYQVLPEPHLLFNNFAQDVHPLRGLVKHGPYSQSIGFPQKIRPALIAPKGEMAKLLGLLQELASSQVVKDAANYYPPYPGFQQAFRIPIIIPDDELRIEFTSSYNDASPNYGPVLIDEIISALGPLRINRNNFDVLLLYLPIQWKKVFEYEGFDLHDGLKARLAPIGIPVQIINDMALTRKCRANVMWGISIALYAKSGGVPWKLADLNKDEAYIGISYTIKKMDSSQLYVTCCSQVFDPDGTGFEFVAYDAKEFSTDRKGNPYLSYHEMQSVLSKSLTIYQSRHTGRIPQKVYIHKSSHFTDEEIQGAYDTFGNKTEVELVQIVRKSRWYGIKIANPKSDKNSHPAAAYPQDRGTYLPISKNECLLWTQGSVFGVNVQNASREVFKEAALKPLPDPILLRRFSGEGGWHETCSSILGLTKMDWNNNTLYKTIPVTLGYSQIFAEVVKRDASLTSRTYDYRFFM